MDVVWHQTIGPHLDTGLAGLLGQQIAVDFVIAVLEEDRLSPIATLRHGVRQAGEDHSGETSHDRNLS
jgi:hypothetical protein